MSTKKNTQTFQALWCSKDDKEPLSLKETIPFELIGEEPLLVRIEDKSYSVVMRTPGEEQAHAAGLCLGEGIASLPEDIQTIGYDRVADPNVIDVWLTRERKKKIPHLLKRENYISQTSCGICGKKMIKDLSQILTPARNGFELEILTVFDCVKKLTEKQNFYPRTRGSHAALIFDDDLKVLGFAEDVGRHNALDKAIGSAFLKKQLFKARLLVLSSRISYELVQKASRAGLSMIISKSRPTALAAEMGCALNMTLACAFEKTKLSIICGKERIKRQGARE